MREGKKKLEEQEKWQKNEMKWNLPFEREYWRQTVNVRKIDTSHLLNASKEGKFSLPTEKTFATRHYIEFQFSLSLYVSWHKIFTHWQHTTRMYFIMSLMNFDIMCGCSKYFILFTVCRSVLMAFAFLCVICP